jgi:hypothetical protein
MVKKKSGFAAGIKALQDKIVKSKPAKRAVKTAKKIYKDKVLLSIILGTMIASCASIITQASVNAASENRLLAQISAQSASYERQLSTARENQIRLADMAYEKISHGYKILCYGENNIDVAEKVAGILDDLRRMNVFTEDLCDFMKDNGVTFHILPRRDGMFYTEENPWVDGCCDAAGNIYIARETVDKYYEIAKNREKNAFLRKQCERDVFGLFLHEGFHSVQALGGALEAKHALMGVNVSNYIFALAMIEAEAEGFAQFCLDDRIDGRSNSYKNLDLYAEWQEKAFMNETKSMAHLDNGIYNIEWDADGKEKNYPPDFRGSAEFAEFYQGVFRRYQRLPRIDNFRIFDFDNLRGALGLTGDDETDLRLIKGQADAELASMSYTITSNGMGDR